MNDMEREVFIAGLAAAITAKCSEEGLNVKSAYATAQATLYADGQTGDVIGDRTLQAAEIMRNKIAAASPCARKAHASVADAMAYGSKHLAKCISIAIDEAAPRLDAELKM